ncbi:MAG TPA: RnfH family protein [Gammaproteobacteria bacterium]|nr:RnfH family protein [Gammaproteobacteria bacterium]
MDDVEQIDVEVAWATRGRQVLLGIRLPAGATALEAVRQSGILERCPDIDAGHLELGIFGVPVAHDETLSAGDRVEIYRPLEQDPREARRQLAALGLTIGTRRR